MTRPVRDNANVGATSTVPARDGSCSSYVADVGGGTPGGVRQLATYASTADVSYAAHLDHMLSLVRRMSHAARIHFHLRCLLEEAE